MNRKDFLKDFSFGGIAVLIGGALYTTGCRKTENLTRIKNNSLEKYFNYDPEKSKYLVIDGCKYVSDEKITAKFRCDKVLECQVIAVCKTSPDKTSLLEKIKEFEKNKRDIGKLTYTLDKRSARLKIHTVSLINRPIRFPIFDSPSTFSGNKQIPAPVLMSKDFATAFFSDAQFTNLLLK